MNREREERDLSIRLQYINGVNVYIVVLLCGGEINNNSSINNFKYVIIGGNDMIKIYNHTDTERNCCHGLERCRAEDLLK